jgi:glycerol-1-phosphate dehydrogenase [NAD(P)+]
MPFEKIHMIKAPWRICIGKGSSKTIPKILEELGISSTLSIYGHKTYEIAGKEIERIIKNNGIKSDFIFIEKADALNVKTVERKAKEKKVQALLGIGGGKNIDVAKTAAYNLKLPYISIPTIPSHDGIASPCSSILKGKRKYSLFLEPPTAIIVEMELLKKTPLRFFSSGAGDILAKYTSVTDWKLAKEKKGEYYGEYAAKIASLASSIIIENSLMYKEDYESSLRLLIEALISCGYAMCIAGSSRPCSGSEHLFAHAIDFFYPKNQALHGEKVALGTLIMSYLQEKDFELIKQTMKNLNLPLTYKEIRIPKRILIKALVNARKMRKRYTILDEIKFRNENEAEKILKKLEII